MPAVRMPSIRAAAAGARRVLIRFPFVLFAALAAAAIGSALVGKAGRPSGPLMAAMVGATLGLPLLAGLALAGRTGSRRLKVALGLLGIAVLAAVAAAWPHWTGPTQARRYAQLSIGFHLLVAFLPFLDGREPNAFWQYNRTLFLRFLSAGLHSSVLFIGLAVALLAIDKLFGVKVHDSAYQRLWLLVAFVFNTWFFLGGVPEDLGALEQRRDYPRALKVFSQFILIPIVVVYLVILTAYLVRIIVTGQWPSNWIGYLVSSVATVGILSLLLVHPLREDEGYRWVGRYARWFYLALLPAVGMLLAAIGKRIGQYGVTEDRYFIAVLALWLAAISVVFLLKPGTGVRWIPITLAALAFATFGVPLGAYGVSRRNQTDRLRALLEANQVLARGVVTPATGTLPVEARKQISSAVRYLLEAHGEGPVRAVLGDAMPALPADSASADRRRSHSSSNARTVVTALGIPYMESWEGAQTESFSYHGWRPTSHAVPLEGADFHVSLDGGMPAILEIGGEPWRLEAARGGLTLSGRRGTLRFPMDTLIAFARARGSTPDSTQVPRLTQRASGVAAMLVPRTYSGYGGGDSVHVYQMTGDLYLTLSPGPGAAEPPRR